MLHNQREIDFFNIDKSITASHYKNQFHYSINKANVLNAKLTQLSFKSLKEINAKSSSDLKRKLNLFTFEPTPPKREIDFPDIDSIEIFKKAKPKQEMPKEQLHQIEEQVIKQEKLEVKQEEISQVPTTANTRYQDTLLSGAENFSKIKQRIKALVFGGKYKKEVDRIIMTLNPIIFQINEKVDMTPAVQSLSKALNQIYDSKIKDLYIITADQIVSFVVNKAENYLKNTKDKYLYITEVVNRLNSSTITNLFFQRLAYSCPYIIPRQFTKKNFSDRETLLQRQGFISNDESIFELNTRMENLEYLYFSFMYHNVNTYIKVITEYLAVLAEIKVNCVIGNGYKVFLNVLGNKLKPLMWDKINMLSNKINNELKEEQLKTKITDIKAINDMNCLAILKYTELIKTNRYTDMFAPSN